MEVHETDIEKYILNLDGHKVSQNLHIPTKVIKQIVFYALVLIVQ